MHMESIELLEAVHGIALTSLTYTTDTGYTGKGGAYAKISPVTGSLVKVKTALSQVKGVEFHCDELERDPHVTLVYSRTNPIKLQNVVGCNGLEVAATISDIVHWDGHDGDGYIVLKLLSPALNKLNKIFIGAGAIHSFENYEAHMTLNAKAGKLTPELISWINSAKDGLVGMQLYFDHISIEDLKEG